MVAEEYPALEELPYVEDVARTLSPYWFVYGFRGLVTTAFGLFFFLSPRQPITTLADVFGCLLVIEGGIYLLQAIMVYCRTGENRQSSTLGVYLGGFAFSTVVGIAIISHPNGTATILLISAAIWFLAIGILQLFLACLFRAAEVRGGSDLIIGFAGVLYVTLGGVFLANLKGSLHLLMDILGVVVTLFGLQLLYLALRLRRIRLAPSKPSAVDLYASATPGGDLTANETTHLINPV